MRAACLGASLGRLSGFILLVPAGAMAAESGFEAPPAPGQTVPRPFDGETVVANPPCFVYPAVKPFPAYVLQYSRSAQFAPAETQTLTGRWVLNAPERALAPGTWFWRWRPGRPGDGRGAWSPVRRFIVPPEAPVLPFPEITALVRRLGAAHPRVLVPAAGLEALRRREKALNDPARLRRVRQYAQRAANQKLLPEPAFLPDWKHGRLEKYQRTFQTYRPFFAELTRLARDYLLTGNELSGREAKRRLMSIVAWDPAGSTSLHENDEVGTDVVRHCPRAYDWIYPLLSPEERNRCLRVFRPRMQEMYATLLRGPFEKKPYSSHVMGYYEPDLLQACLALSGDLDVAEMLHYTLLQLWSPFYPPYGGADGGWNEGPSYWAWIARVCARTYRLVECAAGIPVQQRSHLRNQVYYKLYGNPPWFKMSPFGDGQEGPARGGDAMLMLAALYRNPYALWYGEQLHARLDDLDAFLFPSAGLAPRPPRDLPQGRCFFDVGLACCHTDLAQGDDDVAFLFRSCPFGAVSHAYADQNTFVLDAYGEPLIIASGYYQLYGCPHHREWTWQTVASNSILVDGHGQKARSWASKGRIAEFATTIGADWICGDAHAAYPDRLEVFERRAVFLRPLHTGSGTVVVIHDRIRAKTPSTFQFLLHALDRMELDPAAGTVWIRHGHSACRVDFLEPAGLDFHQTDQFPVAPERPAPNQWHLQAGTRDKAESATSMIVLQPARRGKEGRLPRPRLVRNAGAAGIVLDRDGNRLVVGFRQRNRTGAFAFCGVRSDGEAVSACLDRDEPRSVVLVRGTVAALESGRILVRAATPADIAVSREGGELWVESANSAPVDAVLFTPFPVGRATDETGAEIAVAAGPAPDTVRLQLPPRRLVRLVPGSSGRAAGDRTGGPFYVPGAPVARFARQEYPRVNQVRLAAPFPGTPGIWALHLEVRAAGAGTSQDRRLAATAGNASVSAEFADPGEQVLEIPAVSLDPGTPVAVALTGPGAAAVRGVRGMARRIWGRNLLPNASFETVVDGRPAGWRPTTITRGAQCRIAAEKPGPGGPDGIAVECTAATGGDFGVILDWPGVLPVPYARRFRLACRVRTDPHDPKAKAGVQATSADWTFCRTTRRIRAPHKWTETALEFELPAGVDLAHLRLHMTASKVGAVLRVDRVALTELPPAEPAAAPAQIPLCMVGDSITWWGEGDWWRKYLLQQIPRLAFVGAHSSKFGYSHAGEGGNSTRNVLARLEAIPASPYYHLLIGTNDDNVRRADEVAARAQATATGIRRIVLGLLAKPGCRKVFLGSILPCHTDNPLRDRTNSAANTLLRRMLENGDLPRDRVVWVEYEKPVRKMPGWQELIRLHPSRQGYERLAEILAARLEQTLGTGEDATDWKASPRFAAGAGVRVDNLWQGDAGGATRIPLIAGWYTLSFRVLGREAPRPAVILQSAGSVKKPLQIEFAIPPEAAGHAGRVHFDFYTGAEGYEYSRSRLRLQCRAVRIDEIMIEKKRPGGVVSRYGRGAFIDTSTPPQPGEWVQFP